MYNVQHKNANIIINFTTIVDRPKTDSWSDNNHLIGMIKPVNGNPTFPLTSKDI